MLAWENKAFLALREFGADKFQVVVPSISILAEPMIAHVGETVDKKSSRVVAMAYLKHLYSDEGQNIVGRNYYRPTDDKDKDKAKAKYVNQFPMLPFPVDQGFGGGITADKCRLVDGASLDKFTRKSEWLDHNRMPSIEALN